MKLNKNLIIAFFIIFTASAAANPTVSINDLPDSATLQDGIDIEGSASGQDLDELSIRMRDPGDSLWTNYIETKDCQGLPDCSVNLNDYSPDSAVEKEFSVYIDNQNGEGNHTEPQTVQFTDGTSDAQLEVSMDNLNSQASTGEDFTFGTSASGEKLDTLKIKYREENGDWTDLETKNCEGLPDCSISSASYSTDTAQNVDFKAKIIEESGDDKSTDPQTVEFTEPSDAQLEVSMDNLDSQAPADEDFSFGVSASGENLDTLTAEYREEGGSWEQLDSKNCEGLPDCSFNSVTYTPTEAQEVDFKAHIEEESGDTDETDPQTVDFVSGTRIDSKSMNNLPDEHFTDTDLEIEGSASGENLDRLEIRVDDGDGFTTWEEKDCNNALDCSIDRDYQTSDTGDVEFKLRAHAGNQETETNSQTVEFVEPQISLTADQPLNTPELQLPVDIGWSVDNPENVDIDYTLTVEDDDGDQVFSEDHIDQTSYSLDEDLDEGVYTWTVEAIDNDGDVRADADGSFELNNAYIDGVTMNDLPNQQLTDEDMEIEASVSGRDIQELILKQREDGSWEKYHEKDCEGMPDCSIDLTEYSKSYEEEVDFKAVAIAGTGDDEERQESDIQTVEFVDEIYLEADFDYHPANPEVDETVEFESESSGDIEEWTWDFGDGDTASGQNVEHEFDEADEYPVELTVSNGDNEDDETKIIDVGTEGDECDIDVSDIEFDPEYVQPDEESTISITVENNGDRQDIQVEFQVNDYRESLEDDTLDSGEEEEYSITISRDYDSQIIATVSTEDDGNNPCGNREWDRVDTLQVVEDGENDATFNFDVEDEDGEPLEDVTINGENGNDFTRYTDNDGEATANVESGTYDITASLPGYESESKTRTIDSGETRNIDFTLERDESAENEGQLSVLAEDLDGERLEDVEITAENGDDETEYTDDDGRAYIYLEEGDYTVTAEKDGYIDQARDIEIEAGERTPVLFEMVSEDEDSVRITDLEYDDTVCRGDTLSVIVSIRNSRDSDEIVTMTTEGLGTETDREVVTDRGDTITREVLLTNVEGSGTEEFTVSIDNSVYDEETGEVEVEDCGTDGDTEAEATGLTAEVNPKTIQAGETVNIRGFVDGIRGATEVEFESNGDQVASTSTDRSGYYSTYVRFNEPGTKSIDIKAGGLTRTRNVEVLATATVGGITAPRQVFESETFEICADVSSQVNADVVLLRNGDLVESKTGVGEVCFETEAGAPGTAIYEIRALTSGSGGSSTRSVQVLEQGNEVESFPGQLASVESGGSIAKVELYNTNDDLKSYDIEITGIDEKWFTQSDETVQLRSGERETVYIYLTPRAEGEYRPLLSVSSEGSTIYSQEIILETEGTTDSRPPGFFQRLLRFLGI